MAGQVMEAQAARLQPPTSMAPFMALPHNYCKDDVVHHLTATATTMTATTSVSSTNTAGTGAAADMAAYLQQLQDAAAEAAAAKSINSSGGNVGNGGGGARGEQCPRCASHDTKFCYYNNYNTSQPRHFCRACRRYWTLGGSLRNVPIGGSTRKRPRLAHHHHHHQQQQQQHAQARRVSAAAHVFGGLGLGGGAALAAPMPHLPPSSSQAGGLLGSLFALGAGAPLLEGRGAGFDFDLGLGLTTTGALLGAGEATGMQMQGLGLSRPGGGSAAAGSSSSFLWPTGLLVENDSVDTWKMPGAGAGSMWPDFAAAGAAPQTGGLLHGGAHLM